MPKQTIVVPVGPPKSGKTTLCQEFCVDDHRFFHGDAMGSFTTASFASPLYDMMGVLVGRDEVENLRRKNWKDRPVDALGGKTLRYALQTLGTEWGRHGIYDKVWIDTLFRNYASRPGIAIDDLRFPNEYEEAKKRGAVFIRLIPPVGGEEKESLSHESESYQNRFEVDLTLEWTSREDLQKKARGLRDKHLAGKWPFKK